MFEFLFKRANGESADAQGAGVAAPVPSREEQAEFAATLAGNEAVAVELILQSEFAGVRLAAAEHVHSQPALEKVLHAIRNTDRRVAKLMQGRLDAIRYQQAEQVKAQACLDFAQRLLQDEKLTPNQVAELDRQWKITVPTPALAEPFEVARAALAARLESQVNLQRTIIDAMAEVRKLPASGLDAAAATQALERLAAGQEGYQQHPEHNALPRHLLSDFAAALEQTRAALAAPARQQSEPAAAMQPAEAADVQKANGKDGQLGQPKQANQPGKQAKTGDQAKPGSQADAPKASKQAAASKESDKQFLEALDAMEAALEQGLLHAAADHDKWLKEHKGARLTHAQTERLNHVRAELKRLGDWARWGGNVSREELVKAVEELPALGLAMSELAKKVGSMRDRWKSLDAVSGHAPKSLWERFDTACTTAYAPAAAHFKQLAEERQNNAVKAQALIAETQALAASAGNGAEWKNIAAAGQRLRQMWGRLGTIDRKEKRKLDQAFDKALSQMLAPLAQQRKLETAEREQLIAEAQQLSATDRHTLDKLRSLQERWQEHAKALPLERKAEQALWQRFRAVCDAIFAKRKETAHAADHERKAHLHAREALCKELETATFTGSDKEQQAAIAKTLRDAAAAWNASGTVPRAAEPKINQRYHNAVAAVQAQAEAIKRRAGAAQANALRDKLRLCQSLESEIGDGADTDIDAAGWQQRWQALPSLANDYEKALHGRFTAALGALDGKRKAYAEQLERNRARLLDEVLRLEIVAGVDSGAEFARERLKMQVEVLQSSLKSGQKPQTASAAYLQLCAMPALADARTASRIEQLFRRIGASERA